MFSLDRKILPTIFDRNWCDMKKLFYYKGLLGLHPPAMEPSFSFCQLHLEFPSSLSSKKYPGPILLNWCYPEWHGLLTAWHKLTSITIWWTAEAQQNSRIITCTPSSVRPSNVCYIELELTSKCSLVLAKQEKIRALLTHFTILAATGWLCCDAPLL